MTDNKDNRDSISAQSNCVCLQGYMHGDDEWKGVYVCIKELVCKGI